MRGFLARLHWKRLMICREALSLAIVNRDEADINCALLNVAAVMVRGVRLPESEVATALLDRWVHCVLS